MKKVLFILMGMIFIYSCSTEDITQDLTEEGIVSENQNITKQSATVTGQYGIFHDPDYPWAFVQNNIWSIDDGDWGADHGQYLWYNSINSWGVKAYTTTGKYDYSGVKSYPGLVYGRHYNTVSENNNKFPIKVSDIKGNFEAEWNVYVQNDGGSGAKYNASYDIWFDTDENEKEANEYEIMIWTLRKNQWPINENNDINKPWKPKEWVHNAYYDVYRGTIRGGKQKVLTFILRGQSGYFKSNLKAFIDKAVEWNWMSDDKYLTSIQAGFEICTAGTSSNRANFVTNKFYLYINE